MTKRRPDPTKMANELAGASAFFQRLQPSPPPAPAEPSSHPSVTPEPASADDVTTSRRRDVTPITTPAPPTAGFDLNRPTASRDSLRLSVDETRALEALRSSLKWGYDLAVSKNDICRAALQWLLEDFHTRGEKSSAVARLKRKHTTR